jgi:glycogen(starch) synthase
MTHLIVCREYPPAPYPPGGIGTYVVNIARLLVHSGETVHIIAQKWGGAPARRTESDDGRLIVHRVAVDEPDGSSSSSDSLIVKALAESDCPSQTFSWQATKLAETLIESEPIDVIEGQEWEAPLYYLQLRRALGLGPRRQPPCLVHLHSPSELIFRHNQWDQTFTDFSTLRDLERYSIRAADEVLCPSRYLAKEAERLFDLMPGSVHVIPYPLGNTPALERMPEVWARDCVCYFGRLELRKGVVEWVDAAVRVARSHSTATFEFIGSDTSLTGAEGQSVREFLKQRIPREVRARFRFHRSRKKQALLCSLAAVPVVTVPSRWDNLPHTCIEAMCTGAPVLVSPNGGMPELVQHERSGWVAPDASAAGLEAALWCFLNTPPETRAAMGREAAKTIRDLCGNDKIVEKHLKLRGDIAVAGPVRSGKVPGNGIPLEAAAKRGMGLVVICGDSGRWSTGCQSILVQTLPARSVVLVAPARHRGSELEGETQRHGWQILYALDPTPAAARALGARALLATAPDLRTAAFLTDSVQLDPGYIDACESIFENQPNVAILSSWMRQEEIDRNGRVRHCSLSLGAGRGEEFPECIAIRAELLPTTLEDGELRAVVYPGVLGTLSQPVNKRRSALPSSEKRYSVMAGAQFNSSGMALSSFIAAPLWQKVKLVTLGLKQPARTVRWIALQARSLAGRLLEARGEHVR